MVAGRVEGEVLEGAGLGAMRGDLGRKTDEARGRLYGCWPRVQSLGNEVRSRSPCRHHEAINSDTCSFNFVLP